MRVIASTFRTAIEASNSSEVSVLFVTLTHPNLVTPLYFNSDIRDYALNGNTYLGAALSISILSDDSNLPQAKVSIPNVDRMIGETVLGLITSPRISLEMYAASDWDVGNPANPIVVPTREYSAPLLFLRNVTCDAIGFTAEIISYDVTSEPWPATRTTRERLPGLYR
jgi:Domain of unknown function (DUF1833)